MNQIKKYSAPLSRRSFLKSAAAGTLALCAVPVLSRTSSAIAAENQGGNMLVLYFSHSGNTRTIAEYIHNRVGGDIIELKPVTPYPSDYDAVVDKAQQEQRRNARPDISTTLPDLEKYDTVFIGYPNWWGTMPMPFFTLLERYPLGHKTIIPFCTHEGSRFGRSERDLQRLCPDARMLDGFEVRGSRVNRAQADVDAWLRRLGLLAR